MSMIAKTLKYLILSLSLYLPLSLPYAHAESRQGFSPVGYEEKKQQANDIAVSIITSGLSCTCARFAEDMRNVLNDLRPDGLRILPILGVGGLQNADDVLFLKGVDMAVVDEDNLRLMKKKNPQLYSNIEQRIQYITKLYNSEFQVVARNDIASYEDLAGKVVNFNLKNSQTEVSADAIFEDLKIDVQRTYYDNDVAIQKLKSGEIAAMIILTGAPQALLAKLTKADGVHFLPLDHATLPGHDLSIIYSKYLPAELTHTVYPNLIDEGTTVPTVANRALLVAYGWPQNSVRYKKLAKFVDTFFNKIDDFHTSARHPKWSEINLSADIPGWTRFKPAADWLAAHQNAGSSEDTPVSQVDLPASNLKTAFEQFIENYRSPSRLNALSVKDREKLFAEFMSYVDQQKVGQATH